MSKIETSEIVKMMHEKTLPAAIDEERKKSPHPLMLDNFFSGDIIAYKQLKKGDLTNREVSAIKFYNCNFVECDLTAALFWMCSFQDCTFKSCNVDRTVFRKCQFDEVAVERAHSRFYINISESYISNTRFISCGLEGIHISGTDTLNLHFQKCVITDGTFQANFTGRELLKHLPKQYKTEEDQRLLDSPDVFDDLVFSDSTIEFTNFRTMEFIDSKFRTSAIQKCAFVDCIIYPYTFDHTSNANAGWGTNSIDIDTLKASQIDRIALKNLFNIDADQYRQLVDSVKDKILQSVFISYSFKDASIARLLNAALRKNNVSTFLWEKDAVGGEKLREIMRSNIDAKDRLLFIASENSIKSEACQFELSQGRLKSDKLWKTILFPIHLDSYLFEVKYDDVRPKQKRDEYWENIAELREINSIDFSKYRNAEQLDDEIVSLLLKSLKVSVK